MRTEGEVPFARRREFYDLVGEIQRDIDYGMEVLVGGDFNEPLEKGEKMKKVFVTLGLANLVCRQMKPLRATKI